MNRALLVAAFLGGCDPAWDPDRTMVLVPQSAEDRWPAVVIEAAAAWNDVLRDACGREAFLVSEVRIADPGEHAVALVSADRWDMPGLSAYVDGPHVRVRDGLDAQYGDGYELAALTHELGHGLGLSHVEGRPSIMGSRLGLDTAMTSEDVDMATGELGCR